MVQWRELNIQMQFNDLYTAAQRITPCRYRSRAAVHNPNKHQNGLCKKINLMLQYSRHWNWAVKGKKTTAYFHLQNCHSLDVVVFTHVCRLDTSVRQNRDCFVRKSWGKQQFLDPYIINKPCHPENHQDFPPILTFDVNINWSSWWISVWCPTLCHTTWLVEWIIAQNRCS